jgi:two-component system nitrogen regulation response regulator NtrX
MIAGSNKVLIIDDENDICDLIADILKEKGFVCAIAKNSDDAMDSIDKEPPSLIFLDIWLQNSNLDGLGVLEVVRQKYPNIPVIMISGHGTIEIAVNAIKMGAYDYIEKPFNSDRVLFAASRAQESLTLKKENAELKRKMMKRSDIVGTGETALNLKAIVDDISTAACRILLEGEFGTGKELIARAIHRKSNQNAPFIKINTCQITSDSAYREAIGNANNSLNLLSTISKGTLFISEVGKLALTVQHKILKFMKEQQSTKLSSAYKADIKIICSSSEDLKKAVKDGMLLQDFYYRISATTITIPPLRERKEDIKSLCTYFLGHFKKNIGFWEDVTIAPEAISLLEEYEWPGNIKQLKNILELLMISARIKSKSIIDASMLPSHVLSYEPADTIELDQDIAHMSLKKARETFEKQYLRMQMTKFNNNISKAALFVGMERSALHRKLKLLDICLSGEEKKKELESA